MVYCAPMREESTSYPGGPGRALRWLRARLLPSGAESMLLASYAMIMAALITFVLFQRDLADPPYYTGLSAIAAMLVLHVLMPDLEARLGEDRAGALTLLANGALWLLVAWIAIDSERFSFVPFLLFMLVAEAIVILPGALAAAYTAAMLGSWLGALWVKGFPISGVFSNGLAMSTGLIFVIIFSTVLKLYRAQTERAEALLADLQAANGKLEAARRHEQELAAAEERVRIARDIHDGLGHHLTALNVQLQAAARLVERDPARAAAAIATCREVAQVALDEVRQSVAAMRRSPLDGRSLPEALAALVSDFGRRAGLAASFAARGAELPLPPAAAQTLYRAAQEGLTNAQRHGAAGSAAVSLRYDADGVSLTVEDDGGGAGAGSGGGFGLAGLRERAELLGGTFSAGPAAGGGYRLTITIPVAQAEERV
jgi:signal transduction histidine kinase